MTKKKNPIPIKMWEVESEYWILLLNDGTLMEIKGVAQLSDLFIKLLQPIATLERNDT